MTLNPKCLWKVLFLTTVASGQDLVPRAYLVTPLGANAVTLSQAWNNGDISIDPSVPIESARGKFQTSLISYYRSFSLLGRSANAVVALPYAFGTFSGVVNGTQAKVHPSGLADGRIRLSVNLKGGPAMRIPEFIRWRETKLLGVSLTAVVPLGQYDRARLVNVGTNRWAFKPEAGFAQRWRRWVLEGYGGIWLFASNSAFFPGNARRTQQPMGALEGHAGYYIRPRLWAAFDTNFWFGGRTAIDGVDKNDPRRESRIGATLLIPFAAHQSFKFSYSRGAVTRIGGNFQTIAAAWQYSWIDNAN